MKTLACLLALVCVSLPASAECDYRDPSVELCEGWVQTLAEEEDICPDDYHPDGTRIYGACYEGFVSNCLVLVRHAH